MSFGIIKDGKYVILSNIKGYSESNGNDNTGEVGNVPDENTVEPVNDVASM